MPTTPSHPSRRTFVAAAASGTAVLAAASGALGQTLASSAEAVIRSDTKLITLINVFVVDPAQLDKLVEVLRDGTATFFSKMPGFVSSSILTGRDRAKAVNYSQWKTIEDVAGFRRDPRFAPYIKKLAALAKAESIECDVAHVIRA